MGNGKRLSGYIAFGFPFLIVAEAAITVLTALLVVFAIWVWKRNHTSPEAVEK